MGLEVPWSWPFLCHWALKYSPWMRGSSEPPAFISLHCPGSLGLKILRDGGEQDARHVAVLCMEPWPGCGGGGPFAPRPCALQRVPKSDLARRRQHRCPYKGREQQKIAVSEHFLPPFRPWLRPRRTWPCCSRARKGSGSPLTPALPLLLLVLSPVLGPGGTEPSSWVN